MKKWLVVSFVCSLLAVGVGGLPSASASVVTITTTIANAPAAKAANGTSVDVCGNAPVGYAHCNAILRVSGPVAISGANAATPADVLGVNGAYSPAFLRSAYNVGSLGGASKDGAGQIVAIVDAYNNPRLLSDIAYYRQYFGLPACAVGTVSSSATSCVIQIVNQSGASSPLPPTSTSWGIEQAIDAEMISALCSNCQLLIVEANTASMIDLGASVNMAVQLGATVVSNSYGAAEFASENDLSISAFNHPGVPIVAAAGDNGYGVQFPAASPNVVAVGGTTLLQNSANGTRNATEVAWIGTGSGCSLYEAKPSWQHDTSCSNRTVADIAAVANPNTGVWIYDTYGANGLYVAGGTSVATAIVSAVFAVAASGQSNGAYPAQNLYANANALSPVTAGSNGRCDNYLCDASLSVDGYNGPTGLGTPGGSPNSYASFAPPSAANLVNTAKATSPAPPPPSSSPTAPTDATALPGNGAVTVGWTPTVNGAGSAVSSYVVSDGEGHSCVNVVSSLETYSCTVSGLINGDTYRFSVTAINDLGKSAPSGLSNAVSPSMTLAVIQVAAGYNYGCDLLASGAVQCWGQETTAPLVSQLSGAQLAPSNVSGIKGATQISAGSNFTCALISGGTVQCWGDNSHGQLGSTSKVSTTTPVTVNGLVNATSVSVGLNYACATLSSGTVTCWGDNASGVLGNGSTVSSSVPVPVLGITNAVSVAASFNHTCALLTTGGISCWGANTYGQLGNAETLNSSLPVPVAGVRGATHLGLGYNNTCALLSDATVTCWGYNGDGELGSGTYANSLTPVGVAGLTRVSQLSTGAYGSCAVIVGGTVQCWGYHSAGQLSFGLTANSNVPVTLAKLSDVTQISRNFDYSYTCATLNNVTVTCWSDHDTTPTLVTTPLLSAHTSTKALAKKTSKLRKK